MKKHVMLMIPQNHDIIRRLESGEAKEKLWLHTGKDQSWLCIASSEKCKGLCQVTDIATA